MMNSFSGGLSGGIWPLHVLFCLVFLVGLVLFTVWLVQFLLKKKQILTWAIVLLIVGILGVLLTFQGNVFRNQHMFDEEHEKFNSPEEFREHMLEEMEEHMGF